MPTEKLIAQMRSMGQINRILNGENEVLSAETVACIAENLAEPDPTQRMAVSYFERAMSALLTSHERLRVERVLDTIVPIAK